MDFSVDIIFRIAAIGIAVAVLSQILTRAGREDQALMTTLAGILVVIFLLIDMIAGLFDTLRTLFNL
jgi:stage III sporulation protein AC